MSITIHTPDDAEKVNKALGELEDLIYVGYPEESKGVLTVLGIAQFRETRQMVRVVIEPDGMEPGQGTKCSIIGHKPPDSKKSFEQSMEEEVGIASVIRSFVKKLTSYKIVAKDGREINLDK
jgi:hypothetical protein